MAELTIDPASIRKALDDFVSSCKPSDTPTQEVGYVATAGDGIAHVTGIAWLTWPDRAADVRRRHARPGVQP